MTAWLGAAILGMTRGKRYRKGEGGKKMKRRRRERRRRATAGERGPSGD